MQRAIHEPPLLEDLRLHLQRPPCLQDGQQEGPKGLLLPEEVPRPRGERWVHAVWVWAVLPEGVLIHTEQEDDSIQPVPGGVGDDLWLWPERRIHKGV